MPITFIKVELRNPDNTWKHGIVKHSNESFFDWDADKDVTFYPTETYRDEVFKFLKKDPPKPFTIGVSGNSYATRK